jgi:hypothetical protein
MINSWSMLSDEMNSSNDDFTILGSYDDDVIDFGQHDFTIDMSADWTTIGTTNPTQKLDVEIDNTGSIDLITPVTPWKYNEEEIVKELLEYIRGTYNQHYSAGDDKIQTLDLIEACGDGEAFCRSNILKYASRYDKKGTARRDIMKILHYAVLLMHFNDKNAKRETYNQ